MIACLEVIISIFYFRYLSLFILENISFISSSCLSFFIPYFFLSFFFASRLKCSEWFFFIFEDDPNMFINTRDFYLFIFFLFPLGDLRFRVILKSNIHPRVNGERERGGINVSYFKK